MKAAEVLPENILLVTSAQPYKLGHIIAFAAPLRRQRLIFTPKPNSDGYEEDPLFIWIPSNNMKFAGTKLLSEA
jgi:hypothetical protein